MGLKADFGSFSFGKSKEHTGAPTPLAAADANTVRQEMVSEISSADARKILREADRLHGVSRNALRALDLLAPANTTRSYKYDFVVGNTSLDDSEIKSALIETLREVAARTEQEAILLESQITVVRDE